MTTTREYVLTDEIRARLIDAHMDEFGDETTGDAYERAYNRYTLDALLTCPERFTTSDDVDLSDLDESGIARGEWDATMIVVLCADYHYGNAGSVL